MEQLLLGACLLFLGLTEAAPPLFLQHGREAYYVDGGQGLIIPPTAQSTILKSGSSHGEYGLPAAPGNAELEASFPQSYGESLPHHGEESEVPTPSTTSHEVSGVHVEPSVPELPTSGQYELPPPVPALPSPHVEESVVHTPPVQYELPPVPALPAPLEHIPPVQYELPAVPTFSEIPAVPLIHPPHVGVSVEHIHQQYEVHTGLVPHAQYELPTAPLTYVNNIAPVLPHPQPEVLVVSVHPAAEYEVPVVPAPAPVPQYGPPVQTTFTSGDAGYFIAPSPPAVKAPFPEVTIPEAPTLPPAGGGAPYPAEVEATPIPYTQPEDDCPHPIAPEVPIFPEIPEPHIETIRNEGPYPPALD